MKNSTFNSFLRGRSSVGTREGTFLSKRSEDDGGFHPDGVHIPGGTSECLPNRTEWGRCRFLFRSCDELDASGFSCGSLTHTHELFG